MLIAPYSGGLVDLCVHPGADAELRARARRLPSIELTDRAVCDLEILATGGFSPLTRFLGAQDYEHVVHEMRLADGRLFPIPVTLPITDAGRLHLDTEIALTTPANDLLAVMRVEEIYPWDRRAFAHHVLGTLDPRHPLVAELPRWGNLQISGPIDMLSLPSHADFRDLRLTPRQTRQYLERLGHRNVVAFHTRNPLHRAHEEMARRAMESVSGVLLLHPTVGMTQVGDIDHYSRVRTYKAVVRNHFRPESAMLALLPLAMRMAGPREALWHAIIRRNYGASHFIVGRDHASPNVDSAGRPFYPASAAQELVRAHADEIGVSPVTFDELVYVPDEDSYAERSSIQAHVRTMPVSGTRLRSDLNRGAPPPDWLMRPDVSALLLETSRPSYRQGFAVWFTGLSGAGKSTTANALLPRLLERGRQVTLLDGDVVRKHLSKGLGFTREERDTNVLRIAFVAAEVVKHGGVAICAAVSPYRETREMVRHMIGSEQFIEVFVDTPVDECELRDPKGNYARARSGKLPGFTGVDDPYEPPASPEIALDTVARTADENACAILDLLIERQWVPAN